MSVFHNGVEMNKVFNNGVEMTSVWHDGTEYPLADAPVAQLYTDTTDPFNDGSLIHSLMLNDNMDDVLGTPNYGLGHFSNGIVETSASANNASIDFDAISGSNDFSFSAWFRVDNSGNLAYFLGNQYMAQLILQSGQLGIWSFGTTGSFQGTGFIPTIGVFHHVVVTATDALKVYVDGVMQGTTYNKASSSAHKAFYCTVASTAATNVLYSLRGAVDQVMLFDKALSQEEVTALYNMEE